MDRSLVGTLEHYAQVVPDRAAFRFLVDGSTDGTVATWTYADAAQRARQVATALRSRGLDGQCALAMFPPGLDFVGAFYGCLYGGVVAVPVYPPHPARLQKTLPKLVAIAQDSGARAILTTTDVIGMASLLGELAPELADLEWIPCDQPGEDRWSLGSPDPSKPAFLQYTSGSTAQPKGVIVSHRNLEHQHRAIAEAFGHRGGETLMSWLPVFHDMGLVGHVMHPLSIGGTSVLMAPQDFVRRPIEWLRAIERFEVNTSGGPNFGYEHCLRRIAEEESEGLDLSRWRVAYCGAEPVRPTTMQAFARRFESVGFRAQALTPCYGLAESTLMATSSPLGHGAVQHGEHVGLGGCFGGGRLVVVDPDTRVPVAAGQQGEVWLQGPSVAAGYWGQQELTARVFGAHTAQGEGPWLRTGDLGRVDDGALVVLGRLKDLIIVRGRNLTAEDLEGVVEESHPVIQRGLVAAFGVERGGTEAVVIACELRQEHEEKAVAEAMHGALASELEVPLSEVAFLARNALPRTSSGKLQRGVARQMFLDGTLQTQCVIRLGAASSPEVEPSSAPTTLPEMEDWLAALVARTLGRDPDSIPRDVPLEALGMESLAAVELARAIDRGLGKPLHATVLYTVPTVSALAAWLVEGGHAVDRRGVHTELYPDLERHLSRLERRQPARYRFDLEADIPWSRIGEEGIYVPPAMFSALGIDPAPVQAHAEAWDMLQAAVAMTVCTAFELVEVTITLFVDTRFSMLGKTRSLELFREEEAKHIALFRRYGEALAQKHPELVGELDWDPAWGVGFWELFRAPDLFPSERVFHYLFWFFFTAFEEHSIYFANLVDGAQGVQPVWQAAHRAHRQEEIQHVTTDHAYLGALQLPPDERDAWSEVCVAWLCQHFDTVFAFGSARRLVAKRYPHLAAALQTAGFTRSPFLGDLLHSPAFRRTRVACPYLRELGSLQGAELPTDAELARRLPPHWLEQKDAVLVPDPTASS